MNDEKKKRLLHQFELSRLKNSTDDVIKDKSLSEGFKNGGVVRGPPQHDYHKTIVKNVPAAKIDTVGEKLPISKPSDVTDKIAAFRALKQAGKKVMGVLPFAGAGYAAMSGDPAMAAEELAGDVPFVGQAYEAFKPEVAGNPEEERQMLAEREAMEAYQNSPAHLARLQALKRMGR
jgi:hypothetical protein